MNYFPSFSSPSLLVHSWNLTKQHSFSSQVLLPSMQHGMTGRHFFLKKKMDSIIVNWVRFNLGIASYTGLRTSTSSD